MVTHNAMGILSAYSFQQYNSILYVRFEQYGQHKSIKHLKCWLTKYFALGWLGRVAAKGLAIGRHKVKGGGEYVLNNHTCDTLDI